MKTHYSHAWFQLLVIGALLAGVSGLLGGEVPAGLRGFKGIMVGTIVEKTDHGFILKVEKVTRVWKQNTATEPQSAIGKNLDIRLGQNRLTNQHRSVLAGLKTGDRVEVEPFHLEGNFLVIMEALKKIESESREKR